MRVARLGPPLAVLVLAGCGTSGGENVPKLGALPLVRGASIVSRVQQCDPGANAYCAIELVVVDNRYPSSDALVKSEKLALKKLGWTRTGPDTGDEHAADSPGRKLRVTYATALGELTGIDLGWIQRPRQITLALSQSVFNRASAMSVMLEYGLS